MAAYYTSQEYDASSAFIWAILTDFPSWPEWFPNLSEMQFGTEGPPRHGTRLIGVGESPDEWTEWEIVRWSAARELMCEHVESNLPLSRGVQAAYLFFELTDDDEGCRLDVEIGAEGQGLIGDLFVGTTLSIGARRLLPQLIDAFNDHVVRRASADR
jgi:hypothetical protein